MREQPARGEQGEPVGHHVGALQPAQGDEAEQTEQRDARDQAELLGDHREHEVAVSVRQQIFDAPLAGTAAEPGGAAHCLERMADLVVIARAGVDEPVNPLGNVGEEVIGLPHAGEADRGQPGHHHPGQPRKEQLDREHGRDHQGHTHVGLRQ